MILGNLLRMGQVLFFIGLFSLPLYFGWDQAAIAFKWPRPTWGVAAGAIYTAMIINFFWHTSFSLGNMSVARQEENANPSEAQPPTK